MLTLMHKEIIMKRRRACFIFLIICHIFVCYAQNKPTQYSKHSKNPIEVMGFTYKSTISQVKKQLDRWGLVYLDFSDEKILPGFALKNTEYLGIVFSHIGFYFDPKTNKICDISFDYGTNSVTREVMEKVFQDIIKDLPYLKRTNRKAISGKNLICDVWIGKDSSEYAVLTDYHLDFYFNGYVYF